MFGVTPPALGRIGPDAKTAIPALIKLFKDEDGEVRWAASSALGQIGPAAISPLMELLSDKIKEVRRAAALAFCYIGPAAKFAVPALTKSLKDNDAAVRCSAARALGNIGPEATMAIPALIELLKDKNTRVRQTAFEALQEINRIRLTRFAFISSEPEEINPILPPVPSGQSWLLVWHDEFDGPKLDENKWEIMPDAPRKDGRWSPKAVSLDGKGHLVISTFKEGDRYIDGCVRTKGGSSIPSATTSPAFNCRSSQGIGRRFGSWATA